MAKMIRIKRGLDADRANYVMQLGELVWATDTRELWVGDGSTLGGVKVTGRIEELFIPKAEKAAANGVATLGADGKIPNNQLPALAITSTFVVNSELEMINLPAQEGDVAVRVDVEKNFIKLSSNYGDTRDWQELYVGTGNVTSVNGEDGVVVLGLGDLNDIDLTGLNSNDVIQWDGNTWKPTNPANFGTKEFTGLNDTPNSYLGFEGNFVKVNDTGDALVFESAIDGGTFNGTTSTLARASKKVVEQPSAKTETEPLVGTRPASTRPDPQAMPKPKTTTKGKFIIPGRI